MFNSAGRKGERACQCKARNTGAAAEPRAPSTWRPTWHPAAAHVPERPPPPSVPTPAASQFQIPARSTERGGRAGPSRRPGEASKPRAIRTKRPASPSSSFPSSPPLAEALYIPAPRVDGLPPCAEAAAEEEDDEAVGLEVLKSLGGDGVARRVREAGDRVIPQEKSVIEIQLFLRNSMRIIPKD